MYIPSSAEEASEPEAVAKRISNTPMIRIPFTTDATKKMALIYKQVLFAKKEYSHSTISLNEVVKRIVDLQIPSPSPPPQSTSKSESPATTWALLFLGSGFFAGAIFDCASGNAVVHKTFQRYTTRRKQGGAQSSSDGARNKNAKSAGAELRRYNERALKADIQDLLTTWSAHLKSCTHIFTRLPVRHRRTIFFNPQILAQDDTRIRSVPFTTGRPTFEELKRCWRELGGVRVEDYVEEVEEVKGEKEKEKGGVEKKEKQVGVEQKQKEKPKEKEKERVELPEHVVKVIELIRKGKLDALSRKLGKPPIAENDEDEDDTADGPAQPDASEQGDQEEDNQTNQSTNININMRLPPDDGTSLLHIASSHGHPAIVSYLLSLGADPTTSPLSHPSSTTSAPIPTPYDVAPDKPTRDAFRRFMAQHPDRWDYTLSGIPSALTDELEQKQKEKQREKRRKQKERERAAKEAKAAREKEKQEKEEKEREERERLEKEEASKSTAGRKGLGRLTRPVGSAGASVGSSSKGGKTGGGMGGTKLGSSMSVGARAALAAAAAVGRGKKELTPEEKMRLEREKRAIAAEARLRTTRNLCAACSKSLIGVTPFEKGVYKYCCVECVRKQAVLFE
ncbi:Ankyrin repeat and zinc finger domain-containing protein 1 [Quaeritorhiza haematococci]|nr:Ankyrin repeat and zinc finger domain-containing protein 1 [Quaeritorhiza haematococci]